MDQVLDDCLAKGVQGLIVITSGFAESGAEGVAAEQRLLHKARGNGMRLVGPSALGIANTAPAVRLNASLAHTLPRRGRIGGAVERTRPGSQYRPGPAAQHRCRK